MRFSDLVGVDTRPEQATAAVRTPVDTDSYLNQLTDEPRNNGFVTALVDRRRGRRMKATRRGFLRGTIAAAAATTAVSAANLFGPAKRVEAQGGVVGSYPRRILQFCPPYNSGDNCQPGCGSSPICTDCCGADGFFRNDPGNGYSLYAGGCGDGDIADGWIWRFSGKCGNCAEIEYRCSDGYVQTDTGPAPFICRTVTDCVPLPDGEEPGPALRDAARDTNWRPAGALELAVDQGGSVAISGWISDGSGVPVQMRIRANNSIVHLGAASLPRPDIAARRPAAGTNVGFAVSFPVEPGQYEFCVDALSGPLNSRVGCVRLTVGSGGSARGSGVTGSITAPSPTTPSTNESPDAATDESTEPAPTPGQIVLPPVGERSASPVHGAVQVIRRTGTTTGFVSGWAGDPDTDEAAYVDIRVDGVSVSTTRTDLPRPDVVRAFEGMSPTSGFAVSFSIPAEATEICVVAADPADGRRRLLGCQIVGSVSEEPSPSDPEPPTATGTSANPRSIVYGALDDVEIASDRIAVTGWAFDPNDRGRTVEIQAMASDQTVAAETGLENRRAQERYGIDAACGFALELVGLSPGTHQLEVVATGVDGGLTTLGRQTVVVA